MANLIRLRELKAEALWRRYVEDEEAFLRNEFHIKHPRDGRIKFDLTDTQVDGLRHWRGNRYSLTLKARQIGWSTLIGGHQFWLAFFHPDNEIIDLSRTERESIALAAKSKYGYRNLAPWLVERGPKSLTEHLQKMVFDNGSSITSMPSNQDPARGSTASLVVVDEWAFLPNPEDAWSSIEPVADVGGSIIGLSTANGVGNFFAELWHGAERGDNLFKTFFAPWNAAPERDDAWYAVKRKTLPSWQLAQEYPTTPEEAFIKSGNPIFDLDMLGRIQPKEPAMVGHLRVAV